MRAACESVTLTAWATDFKASALASSGARLVPFGGVSSQVMTNASDCNRSRNLLKGLSSFHGERRRRRTAAAPI